MSRIQNRRGTFANLQRVNEVPLDGEIIFITDQNRIKIGDGETPFNSLDFLTVEERIIERVVEKSSGSTGLSRKKIIALIEEFGAASKPIVSPDGSVQIVETPTEWQLSVGGIPPAITLVLGQDVSAFRGIYIADDGLAYYASPTTPADKQIFVTREAKSLGEEVLVGFNGEFLNNNAWNFTPGSRIYVSGANGQLSHTAPQNNNIFPVAVSINTDTIQINNLHSIITI